MICINPVHVTLTPSPNRVALLGPAAASAAAHESLAALAASPSTGSPGWEGQTAASITAAAASCTVAGSQLPDQLPDSSHQDPQGCVIIPSDDDEVDAQAQQQQQQLQQQQEDATVSTVTKQSVVTGHDDDVPSTQDGRQVQQAASPSSDDSGNVSASLYPFPTQRSPQDRLEGICRSGACGEDLEGLYVFGIRETTLAEHPAGGRAEGQPDGQPDGQSDGQSAGQADGQADEQADGQSNRQADGQVDGPIEGLAEGQAEGHAEGQAHPSHRQDSQSEQQAVQQFLVPGTLFPLEADKGTQPHTHKGVLQSPRCSTASVMVEAPAAACEETVMPAAASTAGMGALAAIAAVAVAAAEAIFAKSMPEAVAGAAQDRLAQLTSQHDKAFALPLRDKTSDLASHTAAPEAPSAAGAVAAVSPQLASSAAGAATPDVSMPSQSAATAAAPDASEPAQSAVRAAASEEAIPALAPRTQAAAESWPVSPRIAAAAGINGKQSKKRKSKYFSETFDQKKRRINRTRKTKAENRAARAADAALPWSASTKGRFADSPSISGETGTPVSASLSASIGNGSGMLHSSFCLLLQTFFCRTGWLRPPMYLTYPLPTSPHFPLLPPLSPPEWHEALSCPLVPSFPHLPLPSSAVSTCPVSLPPTLFPPAPLLDPLLLYS